MKLSEYTTDLLTPYVMGGSNASYRKGPELIRLFNKYGARDKYDDLGLPDIGKRNGQRPSRTQYTEFRLKGMSGKPELRLLLEEVFNELQDGWEQLGSLNEILKPEGFSVVFASEKISILGGVVDNRKPVTNQAHFENIQSQVLAALDTAKVSIDLAIAWFTNDILRDKLREKQNQGVEVRIVIYNDGVNAAHGVDLTGLTHKYVRGRRGGLMHHKFCVIDNQVVITGSYNWSTNAEFKNDENVSIQLDPEQATKYSVEFRNLQQ